MSLDAIQAHKQRMEAWAEALLEPYLRRLRRHQPPYVTSKEFNDPVWGTLELRPDEVVILDSPVMQRLRRIRQLGVVHFVYPAATHTRLEHSLGVLHQVQQLVTSINSHGIVNEPPDPERKGPLHRSHERLLRLAALCHDVGHGAMSHVSEYSVEEYRECEDIQLGFQREHKKPAKTQLSEIAAYFILGSPAFGRLLDEVERLCKPPHVERLQEKLQSLIIGTTIDEEFLLLHELVTGPFDADKLDYLTRDAQMCGVPVVADVRRLVQKVRAARADKAGLPRKLKRLAPDRTSYLITGIARSGARTLDELAFARILMFDKVYRHQKVRAAEAMVFSLMDQLNNVLREHPSMLPFLLADDQILALNAEVVASLIGTPLKELDERASNSVEAVAYLAQRLQDRRLFCRCFAFAAVMPLDGYRLDPVQKEGLERFIADCARAESRRSLTVEIAELVQQICTVTGDPSLAEVKGGSLEPYIWISPPKPPPKTSSAETGHAYLIDEGGNLVQAEEDAAETPGWADAYVATRDLGYVFSLRILKPAVYVSVEALVRRKYGIRMPDPMLAYAKQNKTAVEMTCIGRARSVG